MSEEKAKRTRRGTLSPAERKAAVREAIQRDVERLRVTEKKAEAVYLAARTAREEAEAELIDLAPKQREQPSTLVNDGAYLSDGTYIGTPEEGPG